MRKHARTLLGLALAAALVTPAAAQPSGGTKVGVLTCRTSASIGLIVGSHQRIACSFAPDAGGGRPDNYAGYITRVGLDLGVTTGGVMTWGVVAPVNGWHHGALAGQYAGASGSVSRRGWRRRQCAGRRLAPLLRAAAAVGLRQCRRQFGARRRGADAAEREITPSVRFPDAVHR
jgi:Protein of unknown function (DUF992)